MNRYCAHQGKRCFPTRHEARTAARLTPAPHCSTYRCEHCGDHHVTHHSKRVQRQFAAVLRK